MAELDNPLAKVGLDRREPLGFERLEAQLAQLTANAQMDDRQIRRLEGIINSMTPQERQRVFAEWIRSAMPWSPASMQRPAATARSTARSRWLSASAPGAPELAADVARSMVMSVFLSVVT